MHTVFGFRREREREADTGRPFNGPGHVALSLTATDRQQQQ